MSNAPISVACCCYVHLSHRQFSASSDAAAAVAAAYRNLANGVTQPDPLRQQDLATVAPPTDNQRHESTVKINASRPARVDRADSAADVCGDGFIKYCESINTAAGQWQTQLGAANYGNKCRPS